MGILNRTLLFKCHAWALRRCHQNSYVMYFQKIAFLKVLQVLKTLKFYVCLAFINARLVFITVLPQLSDKPNFKLFDFRQKYVLYSSVYFFLYSVIKFGKKNLVVT